MDLSLGPLSRRVLLGRTGFGAEPGCPARLLQALGRAVGLHVN